MAAAAKHGRRDKGDEHSIHHRRASACAKRLEKDPSFQRDVGLRPLLATALGLDDAERSSHQQDAVDGLPRRHRGRTACRRRIGSFSQILTSYVWNTPKMNYPIGV